jgi:hypothetical protein
MLDIAGSVRTVLKVAWVNLAILTTLLVCVEGLAFGYYFIRRRLSADDQSGAYVRMQISKMPRDGYRISRTRAGFGAYWKEFSDSTYANVEWAPHSNYHRRPFSSRYINVDSNGRHARLGKGILKRFGPQEQIEHEYRQGSYFH